MKYSPLWIVHCLFKFGALWQFTLVFLSNHLATPGSGLRRLVLCHLLFGSLYVLDLPIIVGYGCPVVVSILSRRGRIWVRGSWYWEIGMEEGKFLSANGVQVAAGVDNSGFRTG